VTTWLAINATCSSPDGPGSWQVKRNVSTTRISGYRPANYRRDENLTRIILFSFGASHPNENAIQEAVRLRNTAQRTIHCWRETYSGLKWATSRDCTGDAAPNIHTGPCSACSPLVIHYIHASVGRLVCEIIPPATQQTRPDMTWVMVNNWRRRR